MPKKIAECTKAHLVSVALPNHAATYTVISHQSVIDYVYTELATAGFSVVDEEFRSTADGQIAQGIHKLSFNSDPELSMMFVWTNSYNKQVRFKCGVGAYINLTGTTMVCGDMGNWARKHTGTADEETIKTIQEQIANAHMYYNQLAADKEIMKTVILNKRRQAQMLGILFAEYQILTTEQASMIRSQMDRPGHVFADSNSLWAFYNYVTTALQHSHPKTWMEDQRVLHYFISTINNFATPQVIPQVTPQVEAVVDLEPNLDLAAYNQDLDIEDSNSGSYLENPVNLDILDEISNEVIEETVSYTDPMGNTFEAPIVPPCSAHDTEPGDEDEDDEWLNAPLEVEEEPFQIDENQEWTGENAATMSLEPTPEEYQMIEEELAEEANLDLLQPVIQVKEKEDVADFDLDFTSSVDVEEDDNEIADFF